MAEDKKRSMAARFLSRKFLMCVAWFVLLFVCIIKDGDMIQSGFAMVIAWTGAIVNCVYCIGAYFKDIASIKYKDIEIKLKEKERKEQK